MVLTHQSPGSSQLGPGQDEKTPKVVLIEVFYRVEEVPIESHQWPTRPRIEGRTAW
jgi:hypothetical protein